MHANGDSFGIIAKELGVTRNVVAGKCKRLGLEFVPKADGRRLTCSARVVRRDSVYRRRPAAVVHAAPPVEPLRLLFGDLGKTSCRWVEDDSTFCGHAADGSYCAYHAGLVYRRAA